MKKFYTREEAIDLLGIGVNKFHRLVREGKLVARKQGQQTIILDEELQEYLRNLPKAPAPLAHSVDEGNEVLLGEDQVSRNIETV